MKLLPFFLLAPIILSSYAWGAAMGKVLCDLSDISKWEGLSADALVSFENGPAAKWAYAKSSTAQTAQIPHDWSSFNALEIAVRADKDATTNIVIILPSESQATKAEDSYSIRIKVDWSGWKKLIIPFNEFTLNGVPSGWSGIDAIRLVAIGDPGKTNPEAALHISDPRLTHIDTPSISDAEFFDALNLDYPGLEKVKVAAKSGDMASARREFANYLRSRTKPVWHFDPHSRPQLKSRPEGVDTAEADRIMRRDLPSCSVYHQFDGQIDWNLNPIDYREWPWQLGRHPFWIDLGRAYWNTGDEKYAREFVYQMTDWVSRCSVPRYTSGNSTYTWRTIEAGIRTSGSWIEAFYRFLSSPSFTDDAIVLMVKSFVEHARHLTLWPTTGNWLTMESDGLMHIGVIFPEFKDAESWRKTATERLYAELDKQVYPDGAQIELTPGYHGVSLRNFLMAFDIARANGYPMPADYLAKIEKMYDYYLKVIMPDGAVPGLNDADCANVTGSLANGFSLFPERRDFEWIATQGAKGQIPKFTSVAAPFAGHLAMRSGWKADDLYLLLDAGPFGYGHQHEDKLAFVASAYGRRLLVDAGNYPYDSSQWRQYVLSTRSHNTVIVDKQDQHRRTDALKKDFVVSQPLPNHWVAAKGFDYASGSYSDGYGPKNDIKVTHTRSIFFVKPRYWIVSDFLKPADDAKHSYESLFHLDAESARVDEATKIARTENAESANMVIAPAGEPTLTARIVKGQEKPEVQGWIHGKSYYDITPIPTAIFGKEASGPTSFAYVFFPIPAGGKCPVTSVEQIIVQASAGVQAVGVAVHFSQSRVDYFIQTEQPGKKVRFLDFETDGEVTYVRVENGRISAALMAGGTGLSKAGEPVAAEIAAIEDLSQTKVRHKF